jgi:hypothetical protein
MRAVVARARLKEAVVWCRLLRYVRSFCRKCKQASYLVESTQMRELGRKFAKRVVVSSFRRRRHCIASPFARVAHAAPLLYNDWP